MNNRRFSKSRDQWSEIPCYGILSPRSVINSPIYWLAFGNDLIEDMTQINSAALHEIDPNIQWPHGPKTICRHIIFDLPLHTEARGILERRSRWNLHEYFAKIHPNTPYLHQLSFIWGTVFFLKNHRISLKIFLLQGMAMGPERSYAYISSDSTRSFLNIGWFRYDVLTTNRLDYDPTRTVKWPSGTFDGANLLSPMHALSQAS